MDRLYNDVSLVQFYDIENPWGADNDGLLRFATESHARRVLDLGCGTGTMAVGLAERGFAVTAVDCAAAMLQAARQRPGGGSVTWIEADARNFHCDEKFDLIYLIGHAFQCLLTDDDVKAVLMTIARHLAPDGRFIFDSRNPAVAEWREWRPAQSRRIVQHPQLGPVVAWNDVRWNAATSIATYDTFYVAEKTGHSWQASSDIRFLDRQRIETLIEQAGLVVDRWVGDWKGAICREEAPELIPVGRRK